MNEEPSREPEGAPEAPMRGADADRGPGGGQPGRSAGEADGRREEAGGVPPGRRPRRRRRLILRVVLTAGAVLVLVVVFFAVANVVVMRAAGHRIYESLDAVPCNDVALVLGTSVRLPNGRPNAYFRDRIDAARRLYESGKVRHLLLSGDNSRAGYSEPAEMRRALLARGVPAPAMTLDYAGFRTLDSVVRAHTVFGLDSFTIVTQRFHALRAVAIARRRGLDVVAYCMPGPALGNRWKVEGREVFARAMAFIDLYILDRQPKFPGPPEPIVLDPSGSPATSAPVSPAP